MKKGKSYHKKYQNIWKAGNLAAISFKDNRSAQDNFPDEKFENFIKDKAYINEEEIKEKLYLTQEKYNDFIKLGEKFSENSKEEFDELMNKFSTLIKNRTLRIFNGIEERFNISYYQSWEKKNNNQTGT